MAPEKRFFWELWWAETQLWRRSWVWSVMLANWINVQKVCWLNLVAGRQEHREKGSRWFGEAGKSSKTNRRIFAIWDWAEGFLRVGTAQRGAPNSPKSFQNFVEALLEPLVSFFWELWWISFGVLGEVHLTKALMRASPTSPKSPHQSLQN